MPLDAVTITALTRELRDRLVGAKIDKVQQPERDIFILSLRSAAGNQRLLLSAGVGTARVHLTDASFENPQMPPMLCMLLRKHLQGARIAALTQPDMERLVVLELDALDELGVPVRKRLVLEMMGRASNLILVGPEGHVIDCLRRVDSELSEKRQVLPGMLYRLPPAMAKPTFFSVSAEERRKLWADANPEQNADKWLLDQFAGLSPLICRELCYRCFGDTNPRIMELSDDLLARFPDAMDAFSELVEAGEFVPFLLSEGSNPRDFSFMPIHQYGDSLAGEQYSSFSELLDAFYTKRDKAERVRLRARDMSKMVRHTVERLRRKLENQRQELHATSQRETWRKYGDLITANIYRMRRGERVLRTEDYYTDGCPEVEIPLDPLKTPQQNAAKYYRDYNKAKTAERYLTELIAKNETELEYLESVASEIERAEGERDLADIRRELTGAGYYRRQKTGKRERVTEQKPLRFRSSSGFEILVGRNNVQNDTLTTKMARRTDIWLHTQKVHGSHVIISCDGQEPDADTLAEAASLAAYYSQGREAGKVPVDYTQVRFVKKPGGARPGMVIYTDYRTIIAQPDEALMERLLVK
jgi:predicted ribosome quality control (RQC) complex YloA/Tae2 family protein